MDPIMLDLTEMIPQRLYIRQITAVGSGSAKSTQLPFNG